MLNAKRIAVLTLVLFPAAALAWGPTAQLAIVTNALHLISKDSNIPLNRLEKDLRAGAMISMDMLTEIYPDLATDPVRAVESEMYLLKAVQQGRVDPFFAYRLGALGKLVAELTSPLRDVSPAYRNLYYADVEKNIEKTVLQPGVRQAVEPKSYFARAMLEARAHDEMILKDYQGGKGYAGVASTTLSEYATRSLNAVADVWNTILVNKSLAGNVSDIQMRKYVLDAYAFYIARKNPREIEEAEQRLTKLTPPTTEMRVRIGDMFYAAEIYERAMQEYRAVLAEDPSRRDVVQKISDYYVQMGDKAIDGNQLETALDDFKTASEANPLHPEAESKRLQAEALITARDGRRDACRAAIERAGKLETLAEDEALKGRYAEAIALLRQADGAYDEVSDEFPAELQQKTRGQKNARYRMQELQGQIVENAQVFSGSGAAQDIRALAQNGTKNLDKQALQALMEAEYQTALNGLENRLQSKLALP